MIFDLCIVMTFLGAMVIQSIMHQRERKDLYNRLMCKDINDYRKLDTKTNKKPFYSAHKKAMKQFDIPFGEAILEE